MQVVVAFGDWSAGRSYDRLEEGRWRDRGRLKVELVDQGAEEADLVSISCRSASFLILYGGVARWMWRLIGQLTCHTKGRFFRLRSASTRARARHVPPGA